MSSQPHWETQPRRADGTFASPRENGAGGRIARSGGGDDGERRRMLVNRLTMAVNLLRSDLARRAGWSFDDDRKIWKTLGYPQEVEIDFDRYLGKYKRSALAGRIVDAPAHTTWRRGVDIVEVDDSGNPIDPDGETEFESAVRGLFDDLSAVEKFERVDRSAGIGRYAILVIGSTAVEPGENAFIRPIDEDAISGPEDIGYLTPYHEGHAKVAEWVEDETSPRDGKPDLYDVTIREGEANTDTVTRRVHWSRVIHVAENPLEGDVFGRPRLQRVYNHLVDVLKIAGGSAEMFWSNVGGTLWGKVPPGTQIETGTDQTVDDVLEKFADDILESFHRQRRVNITRGIEDLQFVGAGTPDPTGIFEVLRALISAEGIPESVLFGTQRGDVATSHDLREWLGRISERQERFAAPVVVRPFVDRMIDLDVVPEPSAGYRAQWPSLHELDEAEEAEVLSSRATAAKTVSEAIVVGGERAVQILRTLVPELEGALSDDVEALANFVAEEDDLSREDVERWIEHRAAARS